MQFKNRNQSPSFFYHIILTSAIAVVFSLVFTQSVFAAFPDGWQFRKSHVINSAAGAGTGYQVRITVNYGAGVDSGENVYLNGNCQTDFDDIRFVSSDGTTELDYWLETGSLTPSGSAVFWVKLIEDLGTANRTIYVYYGNLDPAEDTTSDGDNAFIFFDDFVGTLAKWTVEKELSPGVITLNAASSYVRCGGGQTSGTYGHTSLGSAPVYDNFTDGAIEVRLKQSVNALGEIAYRGNYVLNAGTGYKGRFDCRTGNETPHMRPPYFGWGGFGAAVTRFGIGTDTWYRGSVTVTSSAGSYTHRIFRNDVLMSSTTDTTYAGPGEIALQNHYGSYSDYDWVAVRKFVYPEPVDDVWGAEETLAADVWATKNVTDQIDADADTFISSGDTMRYIVKIYNTGNIAALGTTLTDGIPVNTTYAGNLTMSSGDSLSYNGGLDQVEWTGDVAVGAEIVITFDVTIDFFPGPADDLPIGTVITNQGTVAFDSDNDGINDLTVDTDGNLAIPGIQTRDFTIGGQAQGIALKEAVDLNGGDLEPGDTVEYTITMTNQSGTPLASPLEFTDVMPDNTTYVTGSATVDLDVPPTGNITISYDLPTRTLTITGLDIGIDDGTDDYSTLVVKFQVKLADQFPAGVTQISNQGTIFYDSGPPNGNDAFQSTDGVSGTPGNQPTVSLVTVATISGTVFNDVNNNNTADAGEGIPGVDVLLSFQSLLYSTDIDGYYMFTGLPSGTYTVTPDPTGTDPELLNYTATTTPNPDTVTLPPDATEIDFGYQTNGNADLEVVKNCTTVAPDGTNQLVFVITVTNEGPDPAANVVLTDDLTSFGAGLTNIEYTVDGIVPTIPSWSGSYDFGTINNTISHTVRIYADVSETFSPQENTASVVSDIFDPATGDNTSSCTNLIDSGARKAMQFDPATNASVTVASAPSLQLTTSGTVEAWIYVDEFQANSELIGKGTVDETFDIGLCGGDPGDEFAGGSAQNIGFALYETNGTPHLLIADTQTLNVRQWYHIACTWTGTAPGGNILMAIYINGIEKASRSDAFASTVQTNTEDLAIGFNHLTGGRFIGIMDEVRIWDIARGQSDIRDTMCQKLAGTESGLVGNWRFDEGSGIVCNDVSAYGNIGITNAERVCSSAPIGDDSAHDYTGSAFEINGIPADLDITSSYGDYIHVFDDGGTWDDNPAPPGPPYESVLQVYRVDAPPENYGQPLFWKSMGLAPHYWGVFKSGGTDPTYTVVYNYTGYPYTNENSLNLAYRNNNCESWKSANAEQDDVNDLLTRAGFSGTEFILGQDVDPRNAIDYDGSDDYVEIPNDSSLNLDDNGTMEAWIYPESFTAGAGIVFKGSSSVAYGFGLGGQGSGVFTGGSNNNIGFVLGAGTDFLLTGSDALSTDNWYHVACTWDESTDTRAIYLNGIQYAFSTADISGVTTTTTDGLRFGMQDTDDIYFDGWIDEVRIWETTRTQTEIRNTMCQKLAGTETGLVSYWRFDRETSDTTVYDYGTDNDGTMYQFGSVLDDRICSSAPIGDDSAYDYDFATTTISANLAHPDGDDMTAAEFSGSWGTTYTGIQVYRVDEAPVYPPDIATVPYAYATVGLTPPPGWSSIDYYRYWGVFVTDWINTPIYQVTYNYDGNPSVPTDETELGLAIREQYCDRTWADTLAVPNTTTNELSHSGETVIDEYILGGINQPLAIALASFYAQFDRENGCVRIFWETATEVDTIGFQIWRSDTPEGPYTLMPGSFQSSKSVSETTGATYSYSDCDADLDTYMTFYYKLEEIDLDSTGNNPFYGPIGPVTETLGASQFNRGNTPKASSGGCFIGALQSLF